MVPICRFHAPPKCEACGGLKIHSHPYSLRYRSTFSCSISLRDSANFALPPTKFVPLSHRSRAAGPRNAKKRLRAQMSEPASIDSRTSMWMALLLRQVKTSPQRLALAAVPRVLRVLTNQGPNTRRIPRWWTAGLSLSCRLVDLPCAVPLRILVVSCRSRTGAAPRRLRDGHQLARNLLGEWPRGWSGALGGDLPRDSVGLSGGSRGGPLAAAPGAFLHTVASLVAVGRRPGGCLRRLGRGPVRVGWTSWELACELLLVPGCWLDHHLLFAVARTCWWVYRSALIERWLRWPVGAPVLQADLTDRCVVQVCDSRKPPLGFLRFSVAWTAWLWRWGVRWHVGGLRSLRSAQICRLLVPVAVGHLLWSWWWRSPFELLGLRHLVRRSRPAVGWSAWSSGSWGRWDKQTASACSREHRVWPNRRGSARSPRISTGAAPSCCVSAALYSQRRRRSACSRSWCTPGPPWSRCSMWLPPPPCRSPSARASSLGWPVQRRRVPSAGCLWDVRAPVSPARRRSSPLPSRCYWTGANTLLLQLPLDSRTCGSLLSLWVRSPLACSISGLTRLLNLREIPSKLAIAAPFFVGQDRPIRGECCRLLSSPSPQAAGVASSLRRWRAPLVRAGRRLRWRLRGPLSVWMASPVATRGT